MHFGGLPSKNVGSLLLNNNQIRIRKTKRTDKILAVGSLPKNLESAAARTQSDRLHLDGAWIPKDALRSSQLQETDLEFAKDWSCLPGTNRLFRQKSQQAATLLIVS